MLHNSSNEKPSRSDNWPGGKLVLDLALRCFTESKKDGWKSNERHLLGRRVMSCLTMQTFGSFLMSCSKEMIYEKMSPVFKVRSCFQTTHNSHVLEENISTEEQWCRNLPCGQLYHYFSQLYFSQCFMWRAIHYLIKKCSHSLLPLSFLWFCWFFYFYFLLKKLLNSLQEHKYVKVDIEKAKIFQI